MRPELPVAAVSKDFVALIAVVAVLLLTAAVAAVFAISVASASASTSAAPAELAAGFAFGTFALDVDAARYYFDCYY